MRVAAHRDLVYRVAWSPDGQHWATASADGTCLVFVAGTDKPLTRFAGHSRAVLAICFLPDGKTVASAGVDQTVQLWDAHSGKHLRTLDNHVGTVVDLAAGPAPAAGTAPQIVSVSEDRTVRLWQPAIGRLVRFARLPSVPRAVAWPTENRLFVGCNDGSVRVLDTETMEVVNEKRGLEGRIHVLIPTPQRGGVFVTGENGRLRQVEIAP
jgi:WD40 repeat protein